MRDILKSILFKKLISKFGIYFNDIDIHGLKFNNVKYSSLKSFYFNPNFEIETFKFLKNSNYDTFIDLGAYFGYFSIFAKTKAEVKNVFSYEASSYNFEQLKKFAKLNNADIKIINKAVGEKIGTVKFYKPIYDRNEKFPSHGQLNNPKYDNSNLYFDKEFEEYEVEMISLTEVVEKNLLGSTLIKLDIEGYEEKSLRSIEKDLKSQNQIDLLVEILINDKNKISIFNFLKSLGYDAYLLTNAGLVYEERPLTLPKPYTDSSAGYLTTLWKDHFFTKKSKNKIMEFNKKFFKYNL